MSGSDASWRAAPQASLRSQSNLSTFPVSTSASADSSAREPWSAPADLGQPERSVVCMSALQSMSTELLRMAEGRGNGGLRGLEGRPRLRSVEIGFGQLPHCMRGRHVGNCRLCGRLCDPRMLHSPARTRTGRACVKAGDAEVAPESREGVRAGRRSTLRTILLLARTNSPPTKLRFSGVQQHWRTSPGGWTAPGQNRNWNSGHSFLAERRTRSGDGTSRPRTEDPRTRFLPQQ